jgi:hypothetical protein
VRGRRGVREQEQRRHTQEWRVRVESEESEENTSTRSQVRSVRVRSVKLSRAHTEGGGGHTDESDMRVR